MTISADLGIHYLLCQKDSKPVTFEVVSNCSPLNWIIFSFLVSSWSDWTQSYILKVISSVLIHLIHHHQLVIPLFKHHSWCFLQIFETAAQKETVNKTFHSFPLSSPDSPTPSYSFYPFCDSSDASTISFDLPQS